MAKAIKEGIDFQWFQLRDIRAKAATDIAAKLSMETKNGLCKSAKVISDHYRRNCCQIGG